MELADERIRCLRKFQKELSVGTVSLALLALLAQADAPLYGYLIAKRLERLGGVLSGTQSAVSGAAQSGRRRAAAQPCRALCVRAAPALLPHHPNRA
ncbi:hypothetical protein FHY11_000467 [Xanthomonas arboricola]|nr:hypothetical protein [Xanthomonas euroxanthea]